MVATITLVAAEKEQGMIAVYKGYEDEYSRGYLDALEDMRRRQQARKQRERERQARRWYFLKQRAAGAALVAVTAWAVWALEGDATIALITIPLALALLFSKKMLVMNDYYFETKEKREGNESRVDRC